MGEAGTKDDGLGVGLREGTGGAGVGVDIGAEAGVDTAVGEDRGDVGVGEERGIADSNEGLSGSWVD